MERRPLLFCRVAFCQDLKYSKIDSFLHKEAERMITLHLTDSVIKSLSRHELQILKFIYDHAEQAAEMTIRQLAHEAGYSPATVMRFCRKLGYTGFSELKYAIRTEMREQTSAEPPQYKNFSTQLILNKIRAQVEGTANLITEEQLLQAYRYFDSGCPIYLWGPGGLTSLLTDYFEMMLFSAGRQNVYKAVSSRVMEHILRSSPYGMVILISASGVFGQTVRLARLAQMNGVPILSITPYEENAIADCSTVSFRFFTEQRENRGAEFTSRLPIFYVIHTIITSYLVYKQNRETLGPEERKEGGECL